MISAGPVGNLDSAGRSHTDVIGRGPILTLHYYQIVNEVRSAAAFASPSSLDDKFLALARAAQLDDVRCNIAG